MLENLCKYFPTNTKPKIFNMSTFNGIVKEFPQIQFDYFRKVDGAPSSLANFLSHIHSDHLNGLAGKSYRAPFIYCSSATKGLLLKLERRLHRINYAKKLVESHEYSYLDYAKRERILRDLPLETPTEIELCPGYTIRVTLFDANHCPGSTLFLVEGNGKSIIYTGDIRAEPWWLEKLKRNPILLPYFRGLKTLDCLYLDTTHASFEASHLSFSPKADGITELLAQIAKYPPTTIFHLNTWTLGYEDAWVALAAYFNSQIHLDDYRLRLYNSIGTKEAWENGSFLLGGTLSDTILTDDKTVRFHSCERWLECEGRDKARREGNLVEISPLVARYRDSNGVEYILKEPGEGGQNVDANAIGEVSGEILVEMAAVIKDKKLLELMQQAGVKPGFSLPLDASTPKSDIKIEEFIDIIKKSLEALILARQEDNLTTKNQPTRRDSQPLPSWFGYPASRHSSFSELQELVKSLAPKDVYPCVAADGSWYQKDSIRKLFGKYCTGSRFAFDIERDLDREYDNEDYDLAERRAAGMEDSSQQACSQYQENTSQEDNIYGQTQMDDPNLRKPGPDLIPPPPTYPHGETQIDRFDPYDPSILAKVERATEEGRLLSKSILGSDSYGRKSHPLEQPRPVEIYGETQVDDEAALGFSASGIAVSYSTNSNKVANRGLNPHLIKVDEMDCSQDSLEEVITGGMDKDAIRDAMQAVNDGRWAEKSRDLVFNSLRWKYQMEEEL
ncbi:hypothetical protein H072_3489 [Dactylellina haptotyla CBS 200.50]|uniref:Protein artemis n=1 Tax=Dactylellina haptotyla (strain CBS 200.50) TaxID=1284197 RepID=S8C4E1_DACHA|nr:hypothetical protein H072_3489 [Dactylellina haptotyla CBS 200.50]